jgi:hypothetical protein
VTIERDTATWVATFARELGTDPPTEAEIEVLLALAGVAAHASERTAAPISCWLAARAGTDPATALGIAKRLAGEAPGSG